MVGQTNLILEVIYVKPMRYFTKVYLGKLVRSNYKGLRYCSLKYYLIPIYNA